MPGKGLRGRHGAAAGVDTVDSMTIDTRTRSTRPTRAGAGRPRTLVPVRRARCAAGRRSRPGPGRFGAGRRGVAVWSRPGFDTSCRGATLTSSHSTIRCRPSTVLRRMRGRAILADEVGLGQDHRGRRWCCPSCGARVGAPGPGGRPGRSGRAVARGTGTKFGLPTVPRGRGRYGGNGRRRAGRGRLARGGPPGAAVGSGGRRLGPDRRGRGAPGAQPAQSRRAGWPGIAAPATCCC